MKTNVRKLKSQPSKKKNASYFDSVCADSKILFDKVPVLHKESGLDYSKILRIKPQRNY